MSRKKKKSNLCPPGCRLTSDEKMTIAWWTGKIKPADYSEWLTTKEVRNKYEKETKMDDNKHDDGKIRPTLVPPSVIRYIAKVREFGLEKYPNTGEGGWKEVGRARITDALYRHLLSYLEDPNSVDEESGLPIIAHIACNAAFLCYFDEQERKN